MRTKGNDRLTIDGDSVDSEDSRDLSDDTSSSSLDSVGVKDGGDVVGLEVVHVDELVRVLPNRLEVGSLGKESSLQNERRRRSQFGIL